MFDPDQTLTIGPAAIALGVLEAQLRRMCNRAEIPFQIVFGRRVFDVSDLDTIRAACVRRGYLPAEEVTADASC